MIEIDSEEHHQLEEEETTNMNIQLGHFMINEPRCNELYV